LFRIEAEKPLIASFQI